MEKFRKYQYAQVLQVLSTDHVKLNDAVLSVATSAPNESASHFLSRIFFLGQLENEYAEVVTGLLNPNKNYLLVQTDHHAVSDIYDAHVKVIRNKTAEHWYFYEV